MTIGSRSRNNRVNIVCFLNRRMAISFEFFGSASGASADELRNRLRPPRGAHRPTPVPIAIAHDAGCRMISANEAPRGAAGRVAGREHLADAPGRPYAEVPHSAQRKGHSGTRAADAACAIANRTSIRNDIEVLRPDGTVRYIQNDVEPLYDADGTVIGCVSICVDLTEQRRAERLLRESDRRKDEFLASLSHELRNPLVPLRNALDELRRSGGDPLVAGRAYAIMERQLFHLIACTDDLLDVSRITRNRIDLQRERIDLHAPSCRAPSRPRSRSSRSPDRF